MTEFEGGTLDLALQPTLNDWVRRRRTARAQALINQNSGNYMGAAFNTTQPPTDNKLVRQALQFALDRQRIADTHLAGRREAADSALVPVIARRTMRPRTTRMRSIWTKRVHCWPRQTPPASRSTSITHRRCPDFGRVGQIWQADLDKIGVKLTLKPTDPVALTNSMQRQQYNGVAVGTGLLRPTAWRRRLDLAVLRTGQQLRGIQG